MRGTCPKVASDQMEWKRRAQEYQNLRGEERRKSLCFRDLRNKWNPREVLQEEAREEN